MVNQENLVMWEMLEDMINMNNKHLHCGGELTLQKEGNSREYDLYFCDKCRKVVKVFTAPSYDEYVQEGYIKRRV